MKRFLLLLLVVVCFSSAMVQAEEYYPRFGIGPRIGIYKSNDADNAKGFVGVQTRFRFTRSFVGEFSVDWRREDFPTTVGEHATVTQWPVLASLLFMLLPESPFSPYVVLGVGWYNTTITYEYYQYDYSDTTQEFGYHAGVGLDFQLAPNIGLNTDIRYNELSIDRNQYYDEKINAGGWIFNAGLTFYM